MPNITGIVDGLSNDLISVLAILDLPPLTEGKILIGRQHVYEQSAPPRVILTPVGAEFGPRGPASASAVALNQPRYSPEVKSQLLNRPIMTERVRFEAQVWGAGDSDDSDYDVTQQYYQALLGVLYSDAVSTVTLEKGVWLDAKYSSGQLVRDGRAFQFTFLIDTPVMDLPLEFVPSNTTPQSSVTLTIPSGGSGSEPC